MKNILLTLASVLMLIGQPIVLRGDVKLPALFSKHMVLQQDLAASVWGWADAGESVTVTIAGQSQNVVADANGKWRVKLGKLAAGGPHTLTVKGKNTITIEDVLIGEVWLGSGQSNMAMQVFASQNAEQEKATANHPQIRMFTVSSQGAVKAQEDCEGDWVVCSPETVGRFSATLFFCGREIHKALKVPVGLINSSVGGTPIESWISPEAQLASPELKPFFEMMKQEDAKFDPQQALAQYEKAMAKWKADVAKAKADKETPPRAPRNPVELHERKKNIGGLFNGKIAPLIPYTIRGALWYQGEANSAPTKAVFYEHQLQLLVQDWRQRWGYEFPMAWVQLPNFSSRGEGWVLVREAMLNALKVPNTGMAITVDIGMAREIHPKNKQDVGKRLSMWALAKVYEQPGIASSGPLPAGHEIRGAEIVLKFQHTNGGLVAKDGELKGFEIAGEDKKWVAAQAKIAGETVIVSHPSIVKPTAARYAWTDNPDCNLFNGAGLPASPFRTNVGK